MNSAKKGKYYLTLACFFGLLYVFHSFFWSFVRINNNCKSTQSIPSLGSFFGGLNYGKWFYSLLSRQEKVLDEEALRKMIKTDYFRCEDFDKMPNTTQSRAENNLGNRGISFIKVKIDGVIIPAVYKKASRILFKASEEYKYHMAIQEIDYLKKLKGLPGIPKIYGYCIKKCSVSYVVERIKGSTFCIDNGTTGICSNGTFLMDSVKQSDNPPLSALKLTHSTLRLFHLLEERHLFFEDISGVNLMFTSDFEVYLIDADSLVFYGSRRLLSQFKCDSNSDCSGPVGNLWAETSLNVRIYPECSDLHGICEDNRCRGVDVSIHACGLAEWFICKLAVVFEDSKIRQEFESVCSCMKKPDPNGRCTFAETKEKIGKLLNSF